MSTIDSYGIVSDGDGGGGGGGGGGQNNNNSGSVGFVPNMQIAFSTDNMAVYKPSISPTSATPTATYQAGGAVVGGGSAVSASISPATGEQTKRKRGRPRKYPLDGSFTPVSKSTPPQPVVAGQSSGGSAVKPKGRPPGSGSGRKQQVAALGSPAVGSPGVGFAPQGFASQGLTPHVIIVHTGEDVSSKIMSFSQNGTQAICILSAIGPVSNVTLRQAATLGGTVTYEGRFDILNLSGSYMLVESGGQRSRTGGLSVLLAGSDGRVLGGGVAGLLIAAAPVQVVVGCFLGGQELKPPNQPDPLPAPPKLNTGGGASAGGSPASRGTLSESSGGPGSPLNQSNGAFNNTNNPHGMSAFSWK